ncbi:MAG: enoyl-CoA hydratase [Myxococcota bacterium]|jgi:enoyl-CoA hydratase
MHWHTEIHGSVATLRYDRSPHNILTLEAVRGLRRAWEAVEQRSDINVVVIAGANGQFLLHTEPSEMDSLLDTAASIPSWAQRRAAFAFTAVGETLPRRPWLRRLLDGADNLPGVPDTTMLEAWIVQRSIELSDKVSVAAIDGSALGGGFETALCCDYRLVADKPDTRLGLPGILVGMLPGFGGTARIRNLIGTAQTRQLPLRGDALTPAAAFRLCLVNESIEADDFDAKVNAITQRL